MKRELLYDESWKLLRRFQSPMEASIAAGLLKGAQIPSYQLDATLNLYMRGRGEANLYVQACDLDRAKDILKSLEETELLSEEELEAEALRYTAED